MIIDFHTHVYPDKIADKGVSYIGDFYGFHLHTPGTIQHLSACCKEAGVEKKVLLAVSIRPDQVDSINHWLRGLLDENTFGFGALHPHTADPIACLEHFKEWGFSGVKYHPDMQTFELDDQRMFPVYAWLEEHRLPVYFHMGDPRYDYSRPYRLARVLDRFPGLIAIAAHLGGYCRWEEAENCLKGAQVYYDTSSALAFMEPERATEIILGHGTDKVLFGTDYPVTNQADELERFYKLDLTPDQQKAILGDNACRLLGI